MSEKDLEMKLRYSKMKGPMLRFLMLIALVAVSCDKPAVVTSDGYPVYLKACADTDAGIHVKAPYTATSPSESPLAVKVLVSSEEYEYPDAGDEGSVAVYKDVTFTGSNEQLLIGVLYPEESVPLYFSSLYPDDNWDITGTPGSKDYKARHEINGSDDLMFAPQQYGYYVVDEDPSDGVDVGVVPTLTFKHLLTCIKLYMYADEEVADAWGPIESISLSNNHVDMGYGSDMAVVDLSSDYDGSTVTFPEILDAGGNPVNHVASFIPVGNSFQVNIGSSAPSTESAYLLVAPVNAKDADAEDGTPIPEFRIDIKAENKDATVDVDLKTTSAESYFSGSTMGKQFSIILKFTMGDAIAVQSSVTDWKTGGIAVGDIDENLIR